MYSLDENYSKNGTYLKMNEKPRFEWIETGKSLICNVIETKYAVEKPSTINYYSWIYPSAAQR